MADDNSETVEKYSFLYERKAKTIFAKLDYFLKNGLHIQREYPVSIDLFRFLNDNYDSLKQYYSDFFNLDLCKEGNEFNNYFFLDLNQGGKSNIPTEYKDYMKNEHIIIGMLFFKMYKIDGNIELDNVKDFTNLLHTEYEEEKNALRKLINDNSSEKSSDLNDYNFEDIIKRAFNQFGKLGWLVWEDENDRNKFKKLPSFERLRNVYQPQIESIDDLINDIKNAE